MFSSILQYFAATQYSGIAFWYFWADLVALGIIIALSLYVYLHAYYNASQATLYKVLVLAPIAFVLPSLFFTLGSAGTRLAMVPSLLFLFILGIIGLVASIAAAIAYGVSAQGSSQQNVCPYHGKYEGYACPICQSMQAFQGSTEPYRAPDVKTKLFAEPKTTGYLINIRTSQVYKLPENATIGRQDSSYTGPDKVTIPGDNYISRSQARIIFDKTRHRIHDSSSASGTYVNGQKISGWTTLEEGDIIRIGKTSLKYARNK